MPSPRGWVLHVLQPGLRSPVVERRFEREDECHQHLKHRFEPQVQQLTRSLASSGLQTVSVQRDGGKLTWTIATKGAPDAQHSVWCSEEKGG